MAKFATGFLSPQLKQAVNEAKKKQVVSPDIFNSLENDNKMYSFTVAGDLTNKQIGGVLKVANTHIEQGLSYAEFKKSFTAKQLKQITSPEPVFVNAISNVYNKARFDKQNELANIRPFLEYITANDEDVRPRHALMNLIVSPVGSSFWQINYPSNGHKCRCQTRGLTRGQVMRRGLHVDNTLESAVSRTRREQVQKGVPLSKTIKPVADKGWKGTWTANEAPIELVSEKFKNFDKKKWFSIQNQKNLLTPIKKTPVPKAKPAATVSEIEKAMSKEQGFPVKLGGLNKPSMAYLIPRYQKAFTEFKKVGYTPYISAFNSVSIKGGKDVRALYTPSLRRISISEKYYKQGKSGVDANYKLSIEKGWSNSAKAEDTLVHEIGHATNAEVLEKLKALKTTNANDAAFTLRYYQDNTFKKSDGKWVNSRMVQDKKTGNGREMYAETFLQSWKGKLTNPAAIERLGGYIPKKVWKRNINIIKKKYGADAAKKIDDLLIKRDWYEPLNKILGKGLKQKELPVYLKDLLKSKGL